MNWLTLILVSIVFYSFGVLFQRKALSSKNSDPIAFSIFLPLLTGSLIFVYALLINRLTLPNLSLVVPNIVLLFVLYGGGNYFQFKALKVTEASTFIVLFSTRVIFTIAASTLILGENLVLKQWVGVILLLISVVLVSLKKRGFEVNGKMFIPLAAAAFVGLANTNDKIILQSVDLYPYLIMAFTLPAIFVSITNPKSIKNVGIYLKWESFKKMFVMAAIFAISSICFFGALQISPNSSQVVTVNLLNVVLTVLLSIVFLKERDNIPNKIIGALLSFVGLFLISS